MSDQPRTKLEVLTGEWTDLKPHAERGAVFLVSPDLDLNEVAIKVAQDDVESIRAWIEANSLQRPLMNQIERWDESPGRSFRFTIVQPYVLIQELGH